MNYSSAKILKLVRPEAEKFTHGSNDIAAVAVETDLAALEREWRGFESSAAGHVFQSFEWISAWYNTIGRSQGITPLIVTGRASDGRLIFLLPLGAGRQFGVTALTWLGGREADLKCGLFDPEFLASVTNLEWNHLWERIRALFPGIDLIYLTDQPERIGPARNPFVLWRTHLQPDRTHSTRLGRDWTGYYEAKRSTPNRRVDRRRSRKLEALGKIEFAIVRDAAGIPAVLEKLMAGKAKLLARIGVVDPFKTDAARDFLSRQAECMYPNGTAHLSVMTLDGEPIAVDWGLIFHKRFYYLLSAYDLEYSHLAPGTRQLHQLMRWCIDNGVENFDFGVGDQTYKYDWCEDHVVVFATVQGWSWQGRAAALGLGAKTACKRHIKTSKFLWPLAQRVRTVLFSLRRRG